MKYSMILIIMCFSLSGLKAQDTIVKVNGDKEVYDNKPVLKEPVEPNIVLGKEDFGLSDKEYFQKGFKDAYKYYTKYSDAGGGTLLTSLLLNGVIGLIPAIACSSIPPRTKNLGYPSQTLMDIPSYNNGYREGARKKKSNKVWMNWTIGTIISTSIIIIAASSVN